ncbi:MalM family protein [Brevundimonas sp.]|uniref:MalM family protein n=1 Tax=Brevundimonas sp. TaxID=1871086 RepID=UPI003D6D735C
MTRLRALAAIGLVGATAAACATAAPPPPAALAYARQDCSTTPDLSTAVSLTPDKERAVHLVATPVGPDTPCLNRAGTAVPYVVYAVPADFGDKTLNVGSALEQARIFAPSVEILDAQGDVTRRFERREYFYRGPVYSVQFRLRTGEAYLLVTAAPELVGQRYDAIQIGVATTVVSTGLYAAVVQTGTEAKQLRTFSYDGTVRVSINDTDIKEGS